MSIEINREIGRLANELQHVVQGIERVGQVLDDTVSAQIDIGKLVAAVQEQGKHLGEMLNELREHVIHGNGQPSLLERVAKLELSVMHHRGQISKLFENYNAHTTATVVTRGQVATAMITMVLTTLFSAAAFLYALFGKG